MTCTTCSSMVKRVTKKLGEVKSSDVNLTTDRMITTYDESKVTSDMIGDRVVKARFAASLMEKEGLTGKAEEEKWQRQEKHQQATRRQVVIAVRFAILLLYISMGRMLPFTPPPPNMITMGQDPLNFSLVQLILIVPILIYGCKFYVVGIRSLLEGNPNMDFLVAIGIGNAPIYSLVMTLGASDNHMRAYQLYYEPAAMVVTLVMLGKHMETKSKGKTSKVIRRLMELAPDTAILYKNGVECEVETAQIDVRQHILIKSGSRTLLDSVLINGNSSMDEFILTGESVPMEKQSGDQATGGSMNYNETMEVEVAHVGNDTTFSRITRMIEDAQGKKAPISKLVDQVAGYSAPVVMGIAAVAAFLWWLVGGKDLAFIPAIFVAVLAVACPCILGPATPATIMVETGVKVGHGILIKSGEALEICHKVDVVILNKTGTITEGRPKATDASVISSTVVEQVWELEGALVPGAVPVSAPVDTTEAAPPSDVEKKEHLLFLVASYEQMSEHPLGQTIVRVARDKQMDLVMPEAFESVTGAGIITAWGGWRVAVGNRRLVEHLSVPIFEETGNQAAEFARMGKMPMYIVAGGRSAGLICVTGTTKETSMVAVEKVKSLGVQVHMVTGDSEKTTRYIGELAHIDHVVVEILPGDKADVVNRPQKEEKTVMMVGDGIDDAPTLIQVDVGYTAGNDNDIALESGDVALVKSDLTDVCRAIEFNKTTIRNIRQNLFWASFCSTLGIPVTAGLLYLMGGLLLSPMFGGFAMSLSFVYMTGNALRLRNLKLWL